MENKNCIYCQTSSSNTVTDYSQPHGKDKLQIGKTILWNTNRDLDISVNITADRTIALIIDGAIQYIKEINFCPFCGSEI